MPAALRTTGKLVDAIAIANDNRNATFSGVKSGSERPRIVSAMPGIMAELAQAHKVT